MGPLGVPELIIIFVVALLVFGPRKLPELGKSLGRGLSEFRRASNELRNTLEEEVRAADYEPPPPPPKLENSVEAVPAAEPQPVVEIGEEPVAPTSSEAGAGDAAAKAVSSEEKSEVPSHDASEADGDQQPEAATASKPDLSMEPKPQPKPDGH